MNVDLSPAEMLYDVVVAVRNADINPGIGAGEVLGGNARVFEGTPRSRHRTKRRRATDRRTGKPSCPAHRAKGRRPHRRSSGLPAPRRLRRLRDKGTPRENPANRCRLEMNNRCRRWQSGRCFSMSWRCATCLDFSRSPQTQAMDSRDECTPRSNEKPIGMRFGVPSSGSARWRADVRQRRPGRKIARG